MLSQNLKNCSLFLQTLQMGLEDGERVAFNDTSLTQLIAFLDQAEQDALALENHPVPFRHRMPLDAYANVVPFIPRKKGSSNDLVS